uniref:Reverse transcriptase domain-containing protein n=2 Tax=Photinus pyralis TaxID=7054 RepID=A0A1Y1MR82_PHOPY
MSLFDLTKAFDCVSHELLIRKLAKYKFDATSIAVIRSYLNDRTQYVTLNSLKSKNAAVKMGVPQGSVLGPILFLVFINDLSSLSTAPHQYLTLFADDTTALTTADSKELLSKSSEKLLSGITQWFTSNGLSTNELKNQSLLLGLHDTDKSPPVKLLGIYIDGKLTWAEHALYLSSKLSKMNYIIRNLKPRVTKQVLLQAYYGYIHSTLSYAVLCWGHSVHAAKVFSVQRKCIRIIDNRKYRDCCRTSFTKLNILTLPCIYIFTCLTHAKKALPTLRKNSDKYHYNVRTKNNLVEDYYRTVKGRDINYFMKKCYNALPDYIRDLEEQQFRKTIRVFLGAKAFYSIDEYLNYKFDDSEQ